jgi:uracil-DNA glycosylase family 4
VGKKKAVEQLPVVEVTLPVAKCELCPILCKSRKRIVNGRGSMDAPILIVGEAPGFDEDIQGKPFVGKSGELLFYMMSEAGMELLDARLTNAVRCRPPGNRTPNAAELANCQPYLLQEIKEMQPKIIVTVGLPALKAVYGKVTKLGNYVGQVLTQPNTGIPILPTYHPSYIMRGRWGQIPQVVHHLEKANQIAKGRNPLQPLEEARRGAVHITEIESLRELRDYLLSDAVSVITLDTESYGVGEEWTGLDWMGAELLCLSLSALDEHGHAIRAGFAVPVLQQHKEKFWGEHTTEALRIIAEIFASDKPKCIQNSLHDLRILERDDRKDTLALAPEVTTAFGFPVNNVVYDTMLIQRLLDENVPANENALMSQYTDMPYYEDEVLAQSKQKTHMELVENEVLWDYAALDSDALARILEAQLKKLRKKPNLAWILENITMPMVRASWNMTRRGVAIDIPYFIQLIERYQVLIVEARDAVFNAYGHGLFNLNAPGQVQNALFNVLKLPRSGRKTKGSRSCDVCIAARTDQYLTCEKHDETGKDALKDVQKMMGEKAHPILAALLHWKEINQQKKNYVDGSNGDGGVAAQIRPDGRVHPELKINSASSGRDSMVKPPLQQMPKGTADEVLGTNILRRPYIAGPGRKCGEADWSQGEVWVTAYRTKDPTLMGLLKSGRDIHSYVARSFCQMDVSNQFPADSEEPGMAESQWKEAYDDLRKKAKVFVFGIGFGMQEQGIAERLHCSAEEGGMLRNIYTGEIFPGLDDYFAEIDYQLEHGGVILDEFGREGHFYDAEFIQKHAHNDWQEMQRTGYNMPIQGGLTDLQQYCHPRFEVAFSERLWVTLTVHDSVFFEYPDTLTPEEEVELMWNIKHFFENSARSIVKFDGKELGWEIPMEISWGESWGHMKNKITAAGTLLLEGADEDDE